MSSMTNDVTLPGIRGPRHRRWIWWTGGIVGGLALVAAVLVAAMLYHMNYVPADLDVSTTKLSAQALYRGTIEPGADPIPINQLHTWTVHLETPDGQPVEDATMTVDGDMPQHGHGLPTQPLVTQYLGNGDYLVEGMKFQMTGWWYVEFVINQDGQQDTVRFDMILK